ncbi:M24 family metallopeptidase [uncultured Clostridium sp.]|jgi:Xaa-Pro aminopeptidase|uniref:M24 family metallopeptidase n=1 Tax=uncultured Clostridium sp. TaxID=59620 RepID=UPI002621BAED|nr:M24 family metallopeptidase [uncultured Clostridium sp.]
MRISKLREAMLSLGLDAVIINGKANKIYFGGLGGSGVKLLITKKSQYQIMDSRYINEANKNSKEFINIDYKDSFVKRVKEIFSKDRLFFLGLEGSHTLAKEYISYQDITSELVLLNDEIEKIRGIKDLTEIDKIRKACELTDFIFSEVIKEIKVGVTELDIAAKINYLAMTKGASGMSFDTIVASGYRSAMPHGRPTMKRLEKGDAVVLDFGVLLDGYQSDMTRTVFVEEISDKMRSIYNIVLEAHLRGIKAIADGKVGKDIDSIARDYIEQTGYGEYFGHGLGHGIGMGGDIPILNKKSEDILEEGMVMSVEPGIYISGFGGIRIEDDVAIIDGKGVPLNKSSKEILILK